MESAISLIGKDLTELYRLKDSLIAKNRKIESFARKVSYDLKSPLNAIIQGRQCVEPTGLDEESQDLLQLAVESYFRMTDIINFLLAQAKLEQAIQKKPLTLKNFFQTYKKTSNYYLSQTTPKYDITAYQLSMV